jgi:hypothetical protein
MKGRMCRVWVPVPPDHLPALRPVLLQALQGLQLREPRGSRMSCQRGLIEAYLYSGRV